MEMIKIVAICENTLVKTNKEIKTEIVNYTEKEISKKTFDKIPLNFSVKKEDGSMNNWYMIAKEDFDYSLLEGKKIINFYTNELSKYIREYEQTI